MPSLFAACAAVPSASAAIVCGSTPSARIASYAEHPRRDRIALSTSTGPACSAARSEASAVARLSGMSAAALSSSAVASGTFGSLAHDLVQQRSGRSRRVEARDVPRDWQAKTNVAPLPDQPVHTLALAADHDADRLGEVEIPGWHIAAHVESRGPNPCPLDFRDRRRDARDLRDSEQLAGARARFDRRGRQRRAAMLGDDRAAGARHLRAAQDRAKVLRVHDPVQRHQQRRIGGEEILQGPQAPWLELGRHALMHPRGDDVETLGRDHLDGREPGELVEARIVAETRGLEDLDHLAGPRSLEHRVATMDQRRGRGRGTLVAPRPAFHAGVTLRQRTPSRESSSAMPRSLSSSRIRSARAKSLAARAASRSAINRSTSSASPGSSPPITSRWPSTSSRSPSSAPRAPAPTLLSSRAALASRTSSNTTPMPWGRLRSSSSASRYAARTSEILATRSSSAAGAGSVRRTLSAKSRRRRTCSADACSASVVRRMR